MSVGLGVGDIVKACQQIYILCRRYKDAREEFDEIAIKAKSTEVVLGRLEIENETSGNIVERAGEKAFAQLQDNLESLRQDSKKLEELVKKYQKIHQDGPGRRLLWALKESGNLVDLRRRIGYHEQTLQLWYMTLVYGSLRRLEGGQEEIIEAIKGLPQFTIDDILDRLDLGDISKLQRELARQGVTKENLEVNMNTAIDYLMAPPVERVRIETKARHDSRMADRTSSKMFPPADLQGGYYSSRYGDEVPQYDPEKKEFIMCKDPLISSSSKPKHRRRESQPARLDKPSLHRSKSTSARPKNELGRYTSLGKDHSYENRGESAEIVVGSSKPPRSPRESSKNNRKSYIVIEPSKDSKKNRRQSAEISQSIPPPSPSLTVPSEVSDSGSTRSTKYYQYRPAHRRSQSADVRRREHDDGERIIVVEEVRSRSRQRSENASDRDSSTHSYVRMRSSSNASDTSELKERRSDRRMISKMDRIDSIPLDEHGNAKLDQLDKKP